jgi:hypothetical protein
LARGPDLGDRAQCGICPVAPNRHFIIWFGWVSYDVRLSHKIHIYLLAKKTAIRAFTTQVSNKGHIIAQRKPFKQPFQLVFWHFRGSLYLKMPCFSKANLVHFLSTHRSRLETLSNNNVCAKLISFPNESSTHRSIAEPPSCVSPLLSARPNLYRLFCATAFGRGRRAPAPRHTSWVPRWSHRPGQQWPAC